jgi:hypothetical protein
MIFFKFNYTFECKREIQNIFFLLIIQIQIRLFAKN